MSLENRYLKYTEDITEDVYNEVIQTLINNGFSESANAVFIEDFEVFKTMGFLLLYNGKTYIIFGRDKGEKKEIAVSEILSFKKPKISPINNLFKRHYEAIVKRGFIDNTTCTDEFLLKLKEETKELNESIQEKGFDQEAIDCICVLANMLIHNGVDIEKELIKNIEHQETRED